MKSIIYTNRDKREEVIQVELKEKKPYIEEAILNMEKLSIEDMAMVADTVSVLAQRKEYMAAKKRVEELKDSKKHSNAS